MKDPELRTDSCLTFMLVLYSEMNEEIKSKYRVVNTMANRIWLFPEIPLGKMSVWVEEVCKLQLQRSFTCSLDVPY